MRFHVISAVFWRNLQQYFNSVLGYLFIVVFVTCCAALTFSPQFFADNLANLDQLTRWFSLLLLVFIPAITMGVWADEKRQGTDSILFTLPASDFDIMLGKYLSVVAVYTIALLFSVTQLIALEVLGDPDWGVIATTYLGYWLAGVSLIAVGMFASSLSSSPTVSFIFGALLCAVPILIGRYFSSSLTFERLGIDYNLNDFALGLVPLSNLLYFVGLTVFMLYLNMVAISERRWKPGSKAEILLRYLVRAASLAVILVSGVYLLNVSGTAATAQADLTSEKLYTLDAATIETLDKIKNDDQIVEIEVFVSKDIPRKYVNTKKQLLGLVKQYREYGGSNVSATVFEVAPNSTQGTDAQGKGIEPQSDRSEEYGRIIERDVFLGAYISSPERTVSIPFFDDGNTIEYELTRSIFTAYKRGDKPTLGILETDAFFAGPEVQGRRMQWVYSTTLEHLERDYELKRLTGDRLAGFLMPPAADGSETPATLKAPDVMLVADPASLDDVSMLMLVQYINAGHPTLILGDPLPFHWTAQAPIGLGILNAPQQERINRNSPYAQILSSSQTPKADGGNATPLSKALGIEWDTGQTVWNLLDPHPDFRGNWPENRLGPVWPPQYGPYDNAFNFVKNSDTASLLNRDSPITSGLKELLFIYPGTIRKAKDSKLNFEPLITVGQTSGVNSWGDVTKDAPQMNQYTMTQTRVIKETHPGKVDEDDHVLAAKITGEGENAVNVVFIGDLDFLSDWFYKQEEELGQKLDNLGLLFNSLDILSGNDQFVNLRNRRLLPRTLTRLEQIFDGFRAEKAKADQTREEEVQALLAKEQEKLDVATAKIQDNQSMGLGEKLQQTFQRASDSQRRFELKQAKLMREKKIEDEKSKSKLSASIEHQEGITRWLSVLLAPLPALILGGLVLWFREAGEQRNIADDRRV